LTRGCQAKGGGKIVKNRVILLREKGILLREKGILLREKGILLREKVIFFGEKVTFRVEFSREFEGKDGLLERGANFLRSKGGLFEKKGGLPLNLFHHHPSKRQKQDNKRFWFRITKFRITKKLTIK
jgi:hypothetical protein